MIAGGVMENQKHFSHGLLYSIPPEDFSSLHLQDEETTGGFEWREFGTVFSLVPILKRLFSFSKKASVADTISKR
jgi:hypothetical protein